jgi:hypothetical protein
MAGSGSNGRGRARRQVPGVQPTRSRQDRLGPMYTAVLWSCDRCGATVTDTDGHSRFHAGLVALWEHAHGWRGDA